MNIFVNRVNLFIVFMNLIGLGSYLFIRTTYAQKYQYLLIVYLASFIPFQNYMQSTRVYFRIIASLAIVAIFLNQEIIQLSLVSLSLALSVKLAYLIINKAKIKDYQKIKAYESIINMGFSLAILLSIICNYFEITRITEQIIILITTLPNLYLSLSQEYVIHGHHHTQTKRRHSQTSNNHHPIVIANKLVYFLSPFYNKVGAYALGYGLGIYISMFEVITITKHTKYLIISLFILIESLTIRSYIKLICIFMRAALVFHLQKSRHIIQAYFILIYLGLKVLFHEDILNIYLMVGYLLIAIAIWREDYQRKHNLSNHRNSLVMKENDGESIAGHFSQREIEMPLINRNSRKKNIDDNIA